MGPSLPISTTLYARPTVNIYIYTHIHIRTIYMSNLYVKTLNSAPPAVTAEVSVVHHTPMNSSSLSCGMSSSSRSTTPNDGKKIRKAYTITKSRESWTDEEHDKFLEALQLFDRDWKKIEDFVGSKTVIQIRSHAQKYFLKVQKNGAIAHVPPPRPKRKAAHPYPQKAPKTDLYIDDAPVQDSMAYPSASFFPGYCSWEDASVLMQNQSDGIMPGPDEYNPQGVEGIPDFSEVYNFIGSVFDPETEGHMQKLKEMDPINFETVSLLMRNLTVNLSSPDFEPFKKVMSSYDVDAKTVSNVVLSQDKELSC